MPDHECIQCQRILNLEENDRAINSDLSKLLVRFDSLIGILKVLSVMGGTGLVGAFGFLISYWVKGGG